MKKFPKTIHVTREDEGENEYLQVREDGVEGMDQQTDVAIYQLVKVGRVSITRTFVEAGGRKFK